MAVHSLGRFDFVTLHGLGDRAEPPDLLQDEIVPMQRPGVNGTAFVLTGIKAQPFQMRSGVDVPTKAKVLALQRGYYTIKDLGAQALVWNDVEYAEQFAVKFVVLEVKVIGIRRISAAAGGLNTNPQYWVDAIWTLQPVQVE